MYSSQSTRSGGFNFLPPAVDNSGNDDKSVLKRLGFGGRREDGKHHRCHVGEHGGDERGHVLLLDATRNVLNHVLGRAGEEAILCLPTQTVVDETALLGEFGGRGRQL